MTTEKKSCTELFSGLQSVPILESTTNKGQIYIIVCTIVALAVICVSTVCYMSYVGKEPSQGMWLLTGGLVGSLTSMLVKTSPTETVKSPALPNGNPPSPVVVTNTPENPVQTEETKP